jgi:methionine-rich copper-binding protein CopC
MPDTINPQMLDAVLVAHETILGNSPAESQGMTLESAAHSISLAMLNAVSTQYSGAQIGNSAVVSACAAILKATAPAEREEIAID